MSDFESLNTEREEIQTKIKKLRENLSFGGSDGYHPYDMPQYDISMKNDSLIKDLESRLAIINAELGEGQGSEIKRR